MIPSWYKNQNSSTSVCDISESLVDKIVTQLVSFVNFNSTFLVLTVVLTYYYKSIVQKKETFPQVTWVTHTPLILNGWWTMKQLDEVGMKLFTDCTAKYGPTFNLPFGPLNVIATSEPVVIQKLLSSNTPTHLSKSSYIYKRLFVQELHDGLFVSKPNTWVYHRKTLSRGFVYNRIISYMTIINHHSENLKDIILTCTEEGPFSGDQFAKVLGLNLLQFTGDLITGPGSYTDHDVMMIHQSIETHKGCLLHVFQHPHLFLRPFWKVSSKKRVSDVATETMMTAMRSMIARYKENEELNTSSKGCDEEFVPLIKLMLQDNWSEKEILDNFATFIFAEHEANFAAIQFILFRLSVSKQHQTKCREEIDNLFCNNTLTISNVTQLKYVENCILESLRLTPPVPLFARRISSPLRIHDNLTIPSSRTIMIMPWVLHRNPLYYPNPDTFDPDRFSSARNRAPYTFIPWSAGRRNCLAWKLSLIHLKVVVAWILRFFEMSTDDEVDSVKMFYAVRVVPERNVRICFTKRVGV